MAPFNQPDQDIQPANTAFWARPIEQPKSDVSTGTLIKGLGKSFDEAVTSADTFVKEGLIKPTEERDLQGMHDEFASALNTARSYQAAPSSTADKPTLMPSGQNLPDAVVQSGPKMELLQNSMYAGKLSETDYYGRIDAYLKRMRQMYPGYRDYIDQEAYRITGVHPANTYIRSQIADLNRMLTEYGSNKDKFETRIHEDGEYYSGDEVRQMSAWHAAGKFTTEMLDAESAQRKNEMFQLKRDQAEYEKQQRDATMDGKASASLLNDYGGNTVSQFMRFGQIAAFGNETPQKAIEDLSTGKLHVSSEQANLAANQLEFKYAALSADLDAFANAPRGSKPSYMNALKGQTDTNYDNIKKTTLQPLRDFIDAIKKGDHDLASLSANIDKGIHEDADLKLTKKDQELGGTMAKLEFVKKNMGEQGIALYYQKNFPNINAKVDGVMKLDLTNAVAQPNLNPGGSGQPNTFKETLEDIKRKKGPDQARSQVLSWIDLYNNKDTSVKAKQNLNRFFYDVSNWDTLRGIENPQVVYQKLFNPTTAAVTAKLGPDAWMQYRGAAEAEGNTIFRKELLTLQSMPNLRFSWNTDNAQLDVLGPERGRPQTAVQAKNALNIMFSSLKSVYDKDPTVKGHDVDTYLVEMLTESGAIDPSRMTGVPAEIINAIMAGRKGAQEKARKAEEQKIEQMR